MLKEALDKTAPQGKPAQAQPAEAPASSDAVERKSRAKPPGRKEKSGGRRQSSVVKERPARSSNVDDSTANVKQPAPPSPRGDNGQSPDHGLSSELKQSHRSSTTDAGVWPWDDPDGHIAE